MVSVYHNLGLGDHIIFCGLIHNLLNKSSPLKIFCKNHNYTSVKALYQGYPVIVVPVTGDIEVLTKMDSESLNINRTVSKNALYSTFDEEVYEEAGIPHIERWSQFIFNMPESCLKGPSKDYIFLHDDIERGYSIDIKKYVQKGKEIYRPNRLECINGVIDYARMILNADEIHVIDSSFRILTDQLYMSSAFINLRVNTKEPKLFYHRYSRAIEGTGWHVPAVKSPYWENIE